MALRATKLFPRLVAAHRALSVSAWSRHERLHEVLPPMESFARRHMGPSTRDIQEMLKTCGVEVYPLHSMYQILTPHQTYPVILHNKHIPILAHLRLNIHIANLTHKHTWFKGVRRIFIWTWFIWLYTERS